ncbi:Bacteriophytochrome [compost metagenome]
MAKKLAQAELKLEQQNALIREQFIAILGHDLRNPLSGIMNAAQLLARKNIGQPEERLVNIIESGSKRMYEMINNIMDLARGRLGGGFHITLVKYDLEKLLNQVSDELKMTWPDRIIVSDFNIDKLIECDPGRLSQLVSNLLGNAITHGAAHTPVILRATTVTDFWEISVINKGKPISKEAIKYLFHPFQRQNKQASQNGLGLGLYIASEIAKAHKGTLTVKSNDEGTCFTLYIPL